MTVYAFDFDGTTTRSDTLLEFIRFACGRRRMLLGFLLYSPLLVLMKLRLYPNWKAKQLVFRHFFGGMDIDKFDALCRQFASERADLVRPEVMDLMDRILTAGNKILVVSASIDNWVRPFFTRFGDSVEVSCTRIAVKNNIVTGQFLTMNCYGREKVKRINALFPNRRFYKLVALGDSHGDDAMFRYADAAFRMSPQGFFTTVHGDDPLVEAHPRQSLGGQVVRFGIVGVTATAIQYGVYLLLLHWMVPAVANTIGYIVSFCFNYVASTKFTFRTTNSARHGAGFALSHVVNYLLQTVLLSFFLWTGLDKRIAMLPVFCICVPVNFILVRFFLTKK